MKATIAILCIALMVGGCSKRNDPADGPGKAGGSAVESAPDSSHGGKARGDRSEYEPMVAVLELSDEETARLKEAFDARDEEIGRWEAEHGERLKGLESQMMAAAKKRRLAEMRSAIAQAKPLRQGLLALVAKHKFQIFMTLPEEKRVEWDAHRLHRRLAGLMEPLNLSDDQVEQIRAKSMEIAATIERPTAEAGPLPRAYLAFEKAVESHVLTAEQRGEFETIKSDNKLRSLKTW